MAESLADKLARAEAGARTPPPAPKSTSPTGSTGDGKFSVEGSDDDDGDLSPFEKQFGSDPFAALAGVVDSIENEFLDGAAALGWDEDIAQGWFNQQRLGLATYLQEEIIPSLSQAGQGGFTESVTGLTRTGDKTAEATGTASNPGFFDLDVLSKFGRQYLSAMAPQVRDAFFPNLANKPGTPRRPGGSGGGGGGGGLTPEQIRAQFDLDELTEAAANQWRGTLLSKPKDPRGLAKSYVDAVVASGGKQKIDFNTFVQSAIRKDPRYGQIYAGKPESMTEGQFMAPYLNQAAQILRPNNVGEAARAGAQLGSSPDAFREKLGRSNETTGSAPFITTMEARMTDLGKVFRG